jgi:catechol 2,3-dioxygenase-like lactoylglutathione lyase family enzyme
MKPGTERIELMQLLSAIPALPVRNVQKSIPFYRDVLELPMRHHDTGFAIFYRDTVEIHLWQADDESWRTRSKGEPVCSGAESVISGTASCRIAVSGVDELYTRLQQAKVIHPNAHISNTEWGTREFGVSDPDNNLITFFERLPKE